MMNKHRSTLSILIHTKNEERNIARCIQSCKGIADEIVVVDMNSTDKTVDIAKKLGARILSVPDYGYVEPARQIGIDALKSEWVFILDADEKLTPVLRAKIVLCMHENSASIFRFPRKNIFLGKWMKFGQLWPDYQVRLFRKGKVVWPTTIHSQPTVLDSCQDLPVIGKYAITHFHRISIKQFEQKIVEQACHEAYYTSLSSAVLPEAMRRISGEFSKRYFENEGYKDGVRGFIFAKSMEYYQFLAFAYSLEQSDFREIISYSDAQLWDTQKQLHILQQELKRIHDSKIYPFIKIYELIKNWVIGMFK